MKQSLSRLNRYDKRTNCDHEQMHGDFEYIVARTPNGNESKTAVRDLK